MTMQHSPIDEAARLWVIRQHESAFDDWDGFTAWLEAGTANLTAYDAVCEQDAWAADLFRHQPAAEPLVQYPPDNALPWQSGAVRTSTRRRWYAGGGAIAAALVAVATFTIVSRHAPSEIVTGPGEHRTIPLADGSRIILNGDSRITIDPDTPRAVELAAGEALFEVRHDARNPFVVTVGGTRLLDAGTVFNVISEDGTLDVAVAEGAVIYEPGRGEIHLAAGDALSRASDRAVPVTRKTSPQSIGGWRSGQLQYSNASLGEIARDLGRNVGIAIAPAGGSERLRFSGTLVVDGPADEVLKRAGPLLGVQFSPAGDGWRMTPTHGASSN